MRKPTAGSRQPRRGSTALCAGETRRGARVVSGRRRMPKRRPSVAATPPCRPLPSTPALSQHLQHRLSAPEASEMVQAMAMEFRRNPGEFQHKALRQPVAITRHGRHELVPMSTERYDWPAATAQRTHRTEDAAPVALAAIQQARSTSMGMEVVVASPPQETDPGHGAEPGCGRQPSGHGRSTDRRGTAHRLWRREARRGRAQRRHVRHAPVFSGRSWVTVWSIRLPTSGLVCAAARIAPNPIRWRRTARCPRPGCMRCSDRTGSELRVCG